MVAKRKYAVDNEEELIAKAERQMRAKKPGKRIPGEKVRVFLTRVGEEIQATGKLTRSRANRLVRQLKNGEL